MCGNEGWDSKDLKDKWHTWREPPTSSIPWCFIQKIWACHLTGFSFTTDLSPLQVLLACRWQWAAANPKWRSTSTRVRGRYTHTLSIQSWAHGTETVYPAFGGHTRPRFSAVTAENGRKCIIFLSSQVDIAFIWELFCLVGQNKGLHSGPRGLDTGAPGLQSLHTVDESF